MTIYNWLVVNTIAGATYSLLWYSTGRKRLQELGYTYAGVRAAAESWLADERNVLAGMAELENERLGRS